MSVPPKSTGALVTSRGCDIHSCDPLQRSVFFSSTLPPPLLQSRLILMLISTGCVYTIFPFLSPSRIPPSLYMSIRLQILLTFWCTESYLIS